MIVTRERLEQREAETLASYAVRASESRGRSYPEAPPRYRTAFQKDRDRVIHTSAFRRLEYKTQVFVNYEGDHYRTRLTHTLEVAQVAKSITRALGLNDDLAETVAFAHDLGHPPFGHAGERTLDLVQEARRHGQGLLRSPPDVCGQQHGGAGAGERHVGQTPLLRDGVATPVEHDGERDKPGDG